MTQCGNCKWKYPEHLVNRMFVNGGYTPEICGICALDITNQVSGANRQQFQGEQAEAARIGAVSWRREHPEYKPKVH